MKKRVLLKLLLMLVAIFFAYILFVIYITSGDTKHYEEDCSPYIALLADAYNENGAYPSTLEGNESKVTLEECGYQLLDDGNFSFYFSEGLGVGGYNSADGQWWHD